MTPTKTVKKLSPFEIIDSMMFKKDDLDFSDHLVSSSYNYYFINRCLSMMENIVPVVQEANKISNLLSKEAHYQFLKNALPKTKYRGKFIKKESHDDQKAIDVICKHFEVGQKDALDYYNMMPPESIKTLKKMYERKDE